MPIYDFVCPDCQLVEEKMQKYSDPPPTCTKCNKEMERKVGTPAVRMVGRRGYHKNTGDWAD